MSEKHKTWKMPEWMKQYEPFIQDTGGNPVEELMNDHTTNGWANSVRAALIIATCDQVRLLYILAKKGCLTRIRPEDVSYEGDFT